MTITISIIKMINLIFSKWNRYKTHVFSYQYDYDCDVKSNYIDAIYVIFLMINKSIDLSSIHENIFKAKN